MEYTTKQFAEKVGVSQNSVSGWLSTHPDFTTKYCRQIKSRGRTGTTWLIHEDGVAVYLTTKNIKGNFPTIRKLTEAKENIANIATEAVKQPQVPTAYMSDPIIAIRVDQINMATKLNEVDHRVALIEAKQMKLDDVLADVNHERMTEGQRRFINDKVRALSIHSGIPFSRMYRMVHEYVGRPALNNYGFEDYSKAIKYLKQLYKNFNFTF